MNSASNRIAKWYQKAFMPGPPSTLLKISAIATASVGAPPARLTIVVSPTSRAVVASVSGETGKPMAVIAAAAVAGSPPVIAAGAFIAK